MQKPVHTHNNSNAIYLDTVELYGIKNDFYASYDPEYGTVITARWNSEPQYYREIPLASIPKEGYISPVSKAALESFNRWFTSTVSVTNA